MAKQELTHERLKKLLSYNPGTGLFTRIHSVRGAAIGDIANYKTSHGYIRIKVDIKSYSAHRLAWFYVYGEFPNGPIDHINGVRSDNRISNLRVVTNSLNLKNTKVARNNKSGVMGVHWCKRDLVWIANASDDGKRVYLGSFGDKWDAICARKSAENRLGYHENHGRL